MPHSSLLFLLVILAAAAAALGIVSGGDFAPQEVEIEAMMEALRSEGSSLFTNAISTSDLKYELLSSPSSSFTIFAPSDSLLYALDMVADAATYLRTLRYHVTPNYRRSFRDLHALPSPFLDTLLPHHSLLLAPTATTLPHNSSALAAALLVDGVRVSAPDLFLGPTFAVHGIDGILLTGLNMYQDLDFDMDSDGLGISFLPPGIMEFTTPSPSDGLGFPFLPPENSPLPSPSDGLGFPFLPPPITPPITDFWNTNYPAIPPSESASNIGTRESWNNNNEEEKKAAHGKRRKRKHKRKRKHRHGAGHQA